MKKSELLIPRTIEKIKKHDWRQFYTYTYNHKTKNNTTGQIPANILLYAGIPTYDTQMIKENKIKKLNKKRQDFEIDTKFRQARLTRAKSK